MVLGEQSVALKQLKFGTLTYIALNSVLCTVNRLFGNVQTPYLNNIYCEKSSIKSCEDNDGHYEL